MMRQAGSQYQTTWQSKDLLKYFRELLTRRRATSETQGRARVKAARRNGSAARAKYHTPRHKVLRRRHDIQGCKPQAARELKGRNIVGKQAYQRVGEPDDAATVESPSRSIASEVRRRANFVAFTIPNRCGQLPSIAQPEVQALPGDGMQRLRGIAQRNDS